MLRENPRLVWLGFPKKTNFMFMCRASQQTRERAFGMLIVAAQGT